MINVCFEKWDMGGLGACPLEKNGICGIQGAFLEPILYIFREHSVHLINNISRGGFEKENMGACPLDIFFETFVYIRSSSRAHLVHFI